MAEYGPSLDAWAKSLSDYGDPEWSPEDLAGLIACANMGLEPDEYDSAWLSTKTSLLPPRRLESSDEKSLMREAPKTKQPPLRPEVDKKLLQQIVTGKFTDDEFLLLFPARTKNDLGIRRARANTIWHLYEQTGRMSEWAYWIPKLVNLDYITVCNMMLAEWIFTKWLSFWARLRCLNSLDDWQLTTKWVSDRLKKTPASMEMRLRYCEAGGISGYRNPPFGDFDFFAESKKLAEGGEPHGFVGQDWRRVFTEAAARVQGTSIPKVVDYLTLEEFIASDLATTGGASTYGKVEWEFEGERDKFKARKNFLLDITTAKYLADETMAHLGKQVNKSFIKPELGKMRIAVTGDIWTYFSQSWLNYLTGEVYLQWPGNTLDERIGEQTARMEEMRAAGKDGYTLPFDFAAFDHQPQTFEIETLARAYLERGISNVPADQLAIWRYVLDLTIVSFSHAVIVAQQGGIMSQYDIEGGVESGIRLTSLLGNYWNGVMTDIGKEWLRSVGLSSELKSWLRGDDSALYGSTYWTVLAMRLCYAGENAVGNDSKYGIHYEESEFLRVWYGREKNFGYPNRAIPGLMQRKPWGSEPWDPEGVIRAQLSTIDTLERRLNRKLDPLRRVVCQDWARIRKQSIRWLQVPSSLGGLGMLKFEGWVPSQAWPHVEHPKIKFTNIESDSFKIYQKQFLSYTLTDNELKQVQEQALIDKTASDDIRGLGSVFRDNYKRELEIMGVTTWSRVSIFHFQTEQLFQTAMSLNKISNQTGLVKAIDTVGSGFGNYIKVQKWWTETQAVARIREIKPMDELKIYNIRMYQAMKALERRGLHRSHALDYLFGKIAGLVVSPLSPLLSSAVQSALSLAIEPWVLSHGRWTRETWGWFTSTISQWYAEMLDKSPLSQELFQW